MKFTELLDELAIMYRHLGTRALGYRLKRDVIKLVTRYGEDIEYAEKTKSLTLDTNVWEKREGVHHSRNRL